DDEALDLVGDAALVFVEQLRLRRRLLLRELFQRVFLLPGGGLLLRLGLLRLLRRELPQCLFLLALFPLERSLLRRLAVFFLLLLGLERDIGLAGRLGLGLRRRVRLGLGNRFPFHLRFRLGLGRLRRGLHFRDGLGLGSRDGRQVVPQVHHHRFRLAL